MSSLAFYLLLNISFSSLDRGSPDYFRNNILPRLPAFFILAQDPRSTDNANPLQPLYHPTIHLINPHTLRDNIIDKLFTLPFHNRFGEISVLVLAEQCSYFSFEFHEVDLGSGVVEVFEDFGFVAGEPFVVGELAIFELQPHVIELELCVFLPVACEHASHPYIYGLYYTKSREFRYFRG